tara:strand:- start:1717 stop:2289 length:573 start_codon:yes stop_codon:yes gene_type:complete
MSNLDFTTPSRKPGVVVPNNAKRRLVSTPQEKDQLPIIIPGEKEKPKFPIPTLLLIIGTLIIIAIIVWFTYTKIRAINPDDLETIIDPDIVNLDAIFNLDSDGQCCVQPGQTNSTNRWIYSPSQNFTYSTDVTDPAIVCQGLTGTNLETCLNKITDDNGDSKVIAHKGIIGYYGFSNGDAGSVCESYSTC